MDLQRRSALPVFLVCAFVMDLCILIVRPTVPLLASSLGASPLVVGMIAATMSLVYTVMAVGFGHLSDLLGRRAIVLVSFLVYGAGCLLIAASTSILQMFLTIAVIGVGMGMFWPIVEAWIADSSGDGRDRAMRKFSLSWSAGTMVGPVIAGALLGASMRFGLALSAAAGLSGLSFLLVLLSGVRESPSSSDEPRAEEPEAAASLFYLSLIALLAVWMTQTTSYTFFPLIASGAGMPPPSSWEGFCSS